MQKTSNDYIYTANPVQAWMANPLEYENEARAVGGRGGRGAGGGRAGGNRMLEEEEHEEVGC